MTTQRSLIPIVLTLAGCAGPVPFTGSITPDLDALIADELAGGSMVIGVVENGELTRFAGFGTTDPDAAAPPTADTTYRIGSVSKLLTGLIALIR